MTDNSVMYATEEGGSEDGGEVGLGGDEKGNAEDDRDGGASSV